MKIQHKVATSLVSAALAIPGGDYLVRSVTHRLTRTAWLRKLDRERLFNVVAGRAVPTAPVRTTIPLLGHAELTIEAELGLSDELGRFWYYFGYDHYEVPVCRTINAILDDLSKLRPQSNSVLIDVGGNIGYYTLMLGALARKCGASVHAFEPSPRVFELLRRNVGLNPELPITLNKLAVSDVEGEQLLFMASEEFGHSSASLVEGSVDQVGSVVVGTTTLDEYRERLEVGPVKLIKMDCEGVEAKVLAGAQQTLECDMPHIVLEVLPRYPSLPSDLAQLPSLTRYRKFLITTEGIVERAEFEPSYANRDWLLSVKPPVGLLARS